MRGDDHDPSAWSDKAVDPVSHGLVWDTASLQCLQVMSLLSFVNHWSWVVPEYAVGILSETTLAIFRVERLRCGPLTLTRTVVRAMNRSKQPHIIRTMRLFSTYFP